jgi:redox-sensitive bicupin YhaK (pirin superfamily)
MMNIKRSNQRGHAEHGWLDSWHSFSFADYFDPQNMGFRQLRVINEDRVAPEQGFGMHPHNDMEIVTYVVSGALSHRDSMGNASTLHAGDVQAMSAGTGILHSEFNGSEREPVHLLQIWIKPERRGITPSYSEKHYTRAEKLNRLAPIAGPSSPLQLNQDATVYAAVLQPGATVQHTLKAGRHAWVQVISGEVDANGKLLQAGDAAAISADAALALTGKQEAELLLFDLN